MEPIIWKQEMFTDFSFWLETFISQNYLWLMLRLSFILEQRIKLPLGVIIEKTDIQPALMNFANFAIKVSRQGIGYNTAQFSYTHRNRNKMFNSGTSLWVFELREDSKVEEVGFSRSSLFILAFGFCQMFASLNARQS